MSSDHRRQSILVSKKRRPSIQLERRGTIRRDSKVPLISTPADGMFGRKRNDSISAETDSAHPESTGLTEQKEDTLASAGIEGPTKQSSDTVTDQRHTAVTAEQGPPAVRRNTFFPDQNIPHVAQAQGKGDDNRSPKEPQQSKEVVSDRSSKEPQHSKEVGSDRSSKEPQHSIEAVSDRSSKELQRSKEVGSDRSSKEPQHSKEVGNDRSSKQTQPVKEVDDDHSAMTLDVTSRDMITQAKEAVLFPFPEDTRDFFNAAFVKKSKWSTLNNFISSLQPHRGGGCSHVLNEVKLIAEGSGAIPSEDQVKEQVKVMAQHAIDSE